MKKGERGQTASISISYDGILTVHNLTQQLKQNERGLPPMAADYYSSAIEMGRHGR